MPKSAQKSLLCFVLLTVSAFSPAAVSAATTPSENTPQPLQNWQCLDAVKTAPKSHSVELKSATSNQFPPPGTDVYIVECISSLNGLKCTTGQCTSDLELLGNCDDLNYLQNNYRYSSSFTNTRPAQSDLEGNVGPFIWTSNIYPGAGHSFYGVSMHDPTDEEKGNFPTLQLGTYYFANSGKSCTGADLRWDPWGRVFDSRSLEPIPGVSVTLNSFENNIVSQVNLPGLTNPQSTLKNGVFNFTVPDGTYTLQPYKSTHTFPNDPGRLNPNYARAYSEIYRGGEIVQTGYIQHRDIPLDPVGTPFTSPVVILDYKISLDKVNSKLLISGSVSHPLSKIYLYSGDIFLRLTIADEFGNFRFTLDNAKIDHSLPLYLEAVKTDLTLQASLLSPVKKLVDTLFSFPVHAQNESDRVELTPIMNNVDGYAYDEEGNVVPDALVTVYLTFSKKPFYSVTADSIGYFNIPSHYLPPLPYFLQIKSPDGASHHLSTAEFASNNAKFAKAASVNYGVYTSGSAGNTANIAYAADPDETDPDIFTRNVIGPEGRVMVVNQKDGSIVEIPEKGQIVTADDSALASKPDSVKSVEPEPASRSDTLVLIALAVVFIFLAAFLVIFLAKTKSILSHQTIK